MWVRRAILLAWIDLLVWNFRDWCRSNTLVSSITTITRTSTWALRMTKKVQPSWHRSRFGRIRPHWCLSCNNFGRCEKWSKLRTHGQKLPLNRCGDLRRNPADRSLPPCPNLEGTLEGTSDGRSVYLLKIRSILPPSALYQGFSRPRLLSIFWIVLKRNLFQIFIVESPLITACWSSAIRSAVWQTIRIVNESLESAGARTWASCRKATSFWTNSECA